MAFKLELSSVSTCFILIKVHAILYKSCIIEAGFFPLNFWWGGLKTFGPRRSPTGTKLDGRTCEKNPTEAKTAHLMQN